jgi:hypothetical protein
MSHAARKFVEPCFMMWMEMEFKTLKKLEFQT